MDGKTLLAEMEEGAFRIGVLVGQDPAVAISAVRQRLGSNARGLEALPPAVRAALPFVVSEVHAALRRRLGMGVA